MMLLLVNFMTPDYCLSALFDIIYIQVLVRGLSAATSGEQIMHTFSIYIIIIIILLLLLLHGHFVANNINIRG